MGGGDEKVKIILRSNKAGLIHPMAQCSQHSCGTEGGSMGWNSRQQVHGGFASSQNLSQVLGCSHLALLCGHLHDLPQATEVIPCRERVC